MSIPIWVWTIIAISILIAIMIIIIIFYMTTSSESWDGFPSSEVRKIHKRCGACSVPECTFCRKDQLWTFK